VLLIPATPGGLSVSESGPSYKPTVQVSWSAVATATEYVVEETLPGEAAETFYDGSNTTVSQLIYADGQVKFRVKACNASGCSAWSGYQTIMLQSGGGGLGALDAQDADPATSGTASQPASSGTRP
jgi:hypothetical protein